MRYFTLLFCFLMASSAMAGGFTTATVDMQRLFKFYPGTTSAQKKFDKLTQQKKQELIDSQKTIKDLQDQLSGDKLSAKQKKAKQEELQQQMQDYAAKKGYNMPTIDTANAVDINNKSGKDWDKAWADKMVDDHDKTISKFKKGLGDVSDPELKDMISNTLPTLQMHWDMCKKLQDKLK